MYMQFRTNVSAAADRQYGLSFHVTTSKRLLQMF